MQFNLITSADATATASAGAAAKRLIALPSSEYSLLVRCCLIRDKTRRRNLAWANERAN